MTHVYILFCPYLKWSKQNCKLSFTCYLFGVLAAPRFRNSIVALPSDLDSMTKRPHSIISVSSSSAGSNSSGSSSSGSSGASCRSSEGARQTSQCSSQSTESGIVADWYSRNSHSGSIASDTLSPPPPSVNNNNNNGNKTSSKKGSPPSRLSVKL